MKALLITDMPEKCLNCPLRDDDMYCKGFEPKGFITKMCVEDYVMHGTRHPSCPLKPMPEKKIDNADFYWDATAKDGWNLCLEELEK